MCMLKASFSTLEIERELLCVSKDVGERERKMCSVMGLSFLLYKKSPEIRYFGGKSYTAARHTSQGSWPACYFCCRWPTGHPLWPAGQGAKWPTATKCSPRPLRDGLRDLSLPSGKEIEKTESGSQTETRYRRGFGSLEAGLTAATLRLLNEHNMQHHRALNQRRLSLEVGQKWGVYSCPSLTELGSHK